MRRLVRLSARAIRGASLAGSSSARSRARARFIRRPAASTSATAARSGRRPAFSSRKRRTDNTPSCRRRQSASAVSGSSWRATPMSSSRDISPPSRWRSPFTASGRRVSARMFDTYGRLLPSSSATSRWLYPCRAMRAAKPSASSSGARSSRCKFSMRASSSGSSTSRTSAGSRSMPASCAARKRRSPATTSRPAAVGRTTIGCRSPCALLDAASSPSFSSSKCLRGCSGFGCTSRRGTRVSIVRCRRWNEPATASRRTVAPSPCCSPASGMVHHMTHLHPAVPTTVPTREKKTPSRASRPPVTDREESPTRTGVGRPEAADAPAGAPRGQSGGTLPYKRIAITNAYNARASIRARPTISGVKMRSAELGFLPIDSIAAAVARPWPMPAPKAAMPSPSPPASAMRPLHHDPPPPSVATSARAGFAIRKTPTATNVPPIRFIPPLLFRPPALPSSPLIFFRSRRDGDRTLHSVVVTHGERDVDRAQHGENEGLHHADERSEGVEGNRDADLREAGEDLHHLVVRHHVGEQPDAERHGPEDVAEQLDDQHEGVEENHRAEELLHVPEAVLARARDLIRDERDKAQTERDVEVGGRRREPRHESDQVAGQDEDEEAREQRHVALRAVADDALGESRDRLDETLRQVARRDAVLGLERGFRRAELPAHTRREQHQESGDEPGRRDLLGEPERPEPGERLVFHQLPRTRIASHTAATGKQVRPTAKPIGSGRCSRPEAKANQPNPRKARSLANRSAIARRGPTRPSRARSPAE